MMKTETAIRLRMMIVVPAVMLMQHGCTTSNGIGGTDMQQVVIKETEKNREDIELLKQIVTKQSAIIAGMTIAIPPEEEAQDGAKCAEADIERIKGRFVVVEDAFIYADAETNVIGGTLKKGERFTSYEIRCGRLIVSGKISREGWKRNSKTEWVDKEAVTQY